MKALLLSGGIGIGAAVWAAYHSMSPTSQLYGRTFIGLPVGSRSLALTYDDGPNDPHTWDILEMLQRHNVKATFFVIGRFVQQQPRIVRAIVDAGHAVGNHTWSHPNLIFTCAPETRRQLQQGNQAIFDATGIHCGLFRPPFGGRRPATLRIGQELGLRPIMWNLTCYDWKAESADQIAGYAERRVQGGDVILLHDGSHVRMGANRSRTVAATEDIITRFQAEGYEFVTIPRMMAAATSS